MRKFQSSVAILLALTLALCALPAQAAPQGVVNINQAGVDELALLPRVGATVAARIVEYREQNGPFETLEDLMLVRGIGERTFEQMRPYIALDGQTSLKEKVRVARQTSEEDSDA